MKEKKTLNSEFPLPMIEAQQVLQGRYTLQKRLGRTAAGHATWLATDTQTDEAVTVKLLAFSPQMEWDELKLFEREAQVLQSLDHPYIPRYRDYFDLDQEEGAGMPWFALVQDYIPGNSLQELLEQGRRFTAEQVQDIALQILDILTYLHSLNPPVLHRDIKPSNLILGENDRVYLIDFGAVQAQAAVTGVTFTVVGTSGYAPLEQFWGRAVPASDIYALGATLIHLLTGVTPAELPQKDGRIQFADKTNANPNLVAWIQKATLSVERRFQTATEALETLKSEKSLFATSESNQTGVHPSLKPKKAVSQVSHFSNPARLKIKIPSLLLELSSHGVLSLMAGLSLITLVVITFILIKLALEYLTPANSIDITVLIIKTLPFLPFIFLFAYEPILAIAKGIIEMISKTLETTELDLDAHYLKAVKKTWYFRYKKEILKTRNIQRILLLQDKHSKRQKIHIKCYKESSKVKRRLKEGEVVLGRRLKEEEAMWLIEEIRNWLDQYQPSE